MPGIFAGGLWVLPALRFAAELSEQANKIRETVVREPEMPDEERLGALDAAARLERAANDLRRVVELPARRGKE